MSKKNSIQEHESTFENKVDLKRCRAILNKNGLEYTDEEILQIRDFLYRMAEMTIQHFERVKEQEIEIVNIQKDNVYVQTESVSLHKSEYRRAS